MYKRLFLCLCLIIFSPCLVFGSQSVDVESLKISHITTVVSVGTSATALPTTALKGRKSVMIQNISTSVVYIGNVNVTADTTSTGGWQLINKGDSVTLDFTDNIAVYAIVASGTANVCVWEGR